MLVNVCHIEVVQVEAHAQIAGAEHAVKIGYRRKLLGDESAIEGIQSFYTFILTLEVSFHESDVRGEVFEERTGEWTAQHGDSHMRILLCQGIYHGHSHGNVALKIYHMKEQVDRPEASAEHKAKCQAKLNVLLEQQVDLSTAIDQLLEDIEAGRKYMKVYRQMKMYNDPSTNPVLYNQK